MVTKNRPAGFLAAALLAALAGAGCPRIEADGQTRIAVFVPGVTSGSPIYEMLVSGARRAAAEQERVRLKVVEGGVNQAEWAEKVTALAAGGEYDLIVSSNPSLPAICAEVGRMFPRQKFLILDGFLEGNPRIYTLLYNHAEMAYLSGVLAALVTASSMPGANAELKVGMIVGQQYPVMDRVIRPGFERGLAAVNPAIRLDFRIVGNWFDAQKGFDLAESMFGSGVDVVLTIAGSAMQGVVKAAQGRGRYVLWFDSSAYSLAPGTIIGCTVLRQDRAAYEKVKLAVEGGLPFGRAEVVGIREGYVDFDDQNELYQKQVPAEVRAKFAETLKELRAGKLVLPLPRF